MNMPSETIALLDVQVNHITKDVGHIKNGAFKKRFKDKDFFDIANGLSWIFIFLLQIWKP